MLDKMFILMYGRENRPRTPEQIKIFVAGVAASAAFIGIMYLLMKMVFLFV